MKIFEKVLPLADIEVATPTGWQDATKLIQTEPYQEWQLITDKGTTLHCADKHNVILEDDSEHFVQDLFVGQRVKTANGVEIVKSAKPTGRTIEMYDLEVPEGHVYYTDDILSHNTTTSMAYLLHQAITRSNITIAILANKGDTAAEVLDRIKFAYESLPWFLQVGIKAWNKRSVELGNGSKIITAATSGSSIRGKSVNCVSGDTIVTVEHNNRVIDITMSELYDNALEYDLVPYYDTRTDNFHVEGILELVQNRHKFDTSSKYFATYMNIILRAKGRQLPDEQCEKHHILPRSMGGSNNKDNIVLLTLREHFVCHKLLTKIVKDEFKHKMWIALYFMSNTRGLSLPSKTYQLCKIATVEFLKARKLPQSARDKISATNKKHWQDKINKDSVKIAKTAAKHRGMKRSSESRKRMSDAAKGRTANNKGTICITDGTQNRYISPDDPIPTGWTKGVKCKPYIAGKIVINNGVEQKLHDKNTPIPIGWSKGRVK